MNPNSDKFNISLNIIYEITLNPDDKHQFANKGDSRFQNVKATVNDIFDKFHTDIVFHLFPEMSMPQFGNSSTHRLSRCHYHGIILFKTSHALYEWLTIRWHSLTSFCSVQLNEYRPEHWDDYIRKQTWLIPRQYRIMNQKYIDIKNSERVSILKGFDESSQDSLPKGKKETKAPSGRRSKAAAVAKRRG